MARQSAFKLTKNLKMLNATFFGKFSLNEKLSEIKPLLVLVGGDVTRPLKFGDEIQMNFKNV